MDIESFWTEGYAGQSKEFFNRLRDVLTQHLQGGHMTN